MKRPILHSAFGVAIPFLLFLIAACDSETALPALPPDAVILAYGNSLTRGVGAKPEESYPAVLEALTRRRVVNAGVRGEESEAGLARLAGLLSRIEPDLVILGHGGNDILRGRDLTRTEANLEKMVNLVRGRAASVVLLGIPNFGFFLGAHSMYERLSSSLRVPLEEDALSEILGDADLKSDLIHPNAAGYRELAEALYRLLREQGAL